MASLAAASTVDKTAFHLTTILGVGSSGRLSSVTLSCVRIRRRFLTDVGTRNRWKRAARL